MKAHGKRLRSHRSVQLESLETRNLLSQLNPIGRPTAEVQLVPPAEVQRVPLKMTFEGTWSASELVSNPSEGVLLRAHIHIVAEGYATPWGQFSVIEDHTIEFLTPSDPTHVPVRFYDGVATFTLGRLPGETVTTTYTGTGSLDTSDPANPLTTDQHHQINGGTGRYQGYTGYIDVSEVALNVTLTNPTGALTSTGVGKTSPIGWGKSQ